MSTKLLFVYFFSDRQLAQFKYHNFANAPRPISYLCRIIFPHLHQNPQTLALKIELLVATYWYVAQVFNPD